MPTPDAAVDKILDIYIDDLLSTGNDAGWHGDSIMSRWIDFGGDPPKGTGQTIDNLKMIREIQFLRRSHPRTDQARAIIRKLDDQAKVSTLCQHAYAGRTRLIFGQYIKMTPKVIAELLQVTPLDHKRAVKRGRDKIAKSLKGIDQTARNGHNQACCTNNHL